MFISQKDFIKISQKTNGRCFYCNRDGEVVDHFVSKSKWNEWDLSRWMKKKTVNDLENLFLACVWCNSSKNNKCPEDFIGNSFYCWEKYKRANARIRLTVRGFY